MDSPVEGELEAPAVERAETYISKGHQGMSEAFKYQTACLLVIVIVVEVGALARKAFLVQGQKDLGRMFGTTNRFLCLSYSSNCCVVGHETSLTWVIQ